MKKAIEAAIAEHERQLGALGFQGCTGQLPPIPMLGESSREFDNRLNDYYTHLAHHRGAIAGLREALAIVAPEKPAPTHMPIHGIPRR